MVEMTRPNYDGLLDNQERSITIKEEAPDQEGRRAVIVHARGIGSSAIRTMFKFCVTLLNHCAQVSGDPQRFINEVTREARRINGTTVQSTGEAPEPQGRQEGS